MKVVITEKPSVARDIARVFKINEKHEGYFSGRGIYITWAFGHLIGLINPDDYDASLKRWSIETLPIIPKTFKRMPTKQDGALKQLNCIKALLNKADLETVICATDAGREGELIFRYIYEYAACKAPVQRLWISSQTDRAIKEGFKNLKAGKDYEPLYDSAKCRTEADWLVGMNATRGYTLVFGGNSGVMSVGRVQTPVLKLIVNRYEANRSFKESYYYEISATIQHENGMFEGKWFQDKTDRILDKAMAEKLVSSLKGSSEGVINNMVQKEKREKPPLLYDLTELQKDANRRFKFSAEKTLKTAQSLYETHKILTYPRTSSRYLSKDIEPTLSRLVTEALILPEFSKNKPAISHPIKIDKRMVDDKKVTDHHAIIPTEKKVSLSALNSDERSLYKLVLQRFLSAFMGDCLKDTTTIISQFGGHTCRSYGVMVRKPGWRHSYGSKNGSKKEQGSEALDLLPLVKKGDPIQQKKTTLEQKVTKAPPLYTEASILAAMETAGKEIEDEDLRHAIKACGLGTPATRAQILERLIQVGYVMRDKNRYIATEKGLFLINSIHHDSLASASLTGDWEKKLNDMAKGSYSRDIYMQEIRTFTKKIITSLKEKAGKEQAFHKDALGVCPKCKGQIVEFKKSYSCTNWKLKGCDFVIWKKIASKLISVTMAKTLLTSGKTKILKGFKSRAGKNFETALALDKTFKVIFCFD